MKCSTGIVRYYELFKIGGCLAIKNFVDEEEDFKFLIFREMLVWQSWEECVTET